MASVNKSPATILEPSDANTNVYASAVPAQMILASQFSARLTTPVEKEPVMVPQFDLSQLKNQLMKYQQALLMQVIAQTQAMQKMMLLTTQTLVAKRQMKTSTSAVDAAVAHHQLQAACSDS